MEYIICTFKSLIPGAIGLTIRGLFLGNTKKIYDEVSTESLLLSDKSRIMANFKDMEQIVKSSK